MIIIIVKIIFNIIFWKIDYYYYYQNINNIASI